MILRRAAAVTLCASLMIGQPALGGSSSDASLSADPVLLCSYPGNHGFIHETGYHVPNGWAARYRLDPPGYFIRGRTNGGEPLETGTYQYVLFMDLQQGALGG